ncbi:hypothetical protein HK102_009806 [Quaeritorhiza haematococci]|nr:hypothetical protein HK102_009806 [Quaeritorhiza haematococci]
MFALVAAIYMKTGRFPRALVDHLWTWIPGIAQFYYYCGCVPGTPYYAEKCMEAGHTVLVFPGGVNEVFRPSGYEKYSLVWKQRTGFARVAVKYGYTLIPVSTIGSDDNVRIVADLSIINHFFRLIGDKRRGWTLPWPNPVSYQMFYMKFGRPIYTATHPAKANLQPPSSPISQPDLTSTTLTSTNTDYLWRIRTIAKESVESGIIDALHWRDEDIPSNRYHFSHMWQDPDPWNPSKLILLTWVTALAGVIIRTTIPLL